jgi:hypothetical protein
MNLRAVGAAIPLREHQRRLVRKLQGTPRYDTNIMIDSALNFGDVAHAIQLALAPVFLLTGIAGILNVMAGRLARIIDRGRQLAEHTPPRDLQLSEKLGLELRGLERRRHFASAAITACTRGT